MLKVKEHVVWRSKQSLLVVLDTMAGHYYTLNPTAQQLWTGLFVESKPFEQILEGILASYSNLPPREAVTDDCRKMIAEWISQGLVEEK